MQGSTNVVQDCPDTSHLWSVFDGLGTGVRTRIVSGCPGSEGRTPNLTGKRNPNLGQRWDWVWTPGTGVVTDQPVTRRQDCDEGVPGNDGRCPRLVTAEAGGRSVGRRSGVPCRGSPTSSNTTDVSGDAISDRVVPGDSPFPLSPCTLCPVRSASRPLPRFSVGQSVCVQVSFCVCVSGKVSLSSVSVCTSVSVRTDTCERGGEG